MKYFSMFSGIGGFELGIQKVGIESTDSTNNQGATSQHGFSPFCVGYSEIDKYAIKVYERNFNGHRNYGDATNIVAADLPDFDLLVGGFPCQAFSVAGKRLGFNETRGTLFFDIARILKDKRPGHFVLENVKGLLSHDSGKTFQTILKVLTDLGYRIEWQVLNSKDFGVPQNRERVYIVGHLGGECGREVFPITGTDGKDIVQINQPRHRNDRVYSAEGVSPTLNTMQGGNRQPFIAAVLTPDRPEKRQNGRRIKEHNEPAFTVTANDRHGVAIREATKTGYAVAEPGDSINFSQPHSKTRRGRVGRGVANTLETSLTQGTLEGTKIRRLTPLECERLQGFPDDWTKYGMRSDGSDIELDSFEVSDTQRYKMCGNAVTVNVVEAVIRGLGLCL